MLSKKYAEADTGRCVACGACLKECPRSAVSIWKGCWAIINEELCVGCSKCAKLCPAGCIAVKFREDN